MHVWQGMFSGRSGNVPQFMRLAFEANPHDRWVGFAVADAMTRRLQQMHPDEAEAAKGWAHILKIRPDDVTALRALWHQALKQGDAAKAAGLYARLSALIPLDPEVLAAQHHKAHAMERMR